MVHVVLMVLFILGDPGAVSWVDSLESLSLIEPNWRPASIALLS